MSKVHNYSAGPCILPQEVFTEASQSVLDFNGIGLSILEISHRSKEFVAVMDEATALVKEILDVPNNYDVVFLQGGASLGFAITAFNYLKTKGDYVDTGAWAAKSLKEAKKIGYVNLVASSADKNYNFIPKEYSIPSDADYLHITSNNTIFGTQIKNLPDTSIPVICDMSSDIFSKKIDVSKFDMIYAGAQKNLGPAGVTLYIIKKGTLGKTDNNIPTMLNLETHIKKDSMYNTPPVFSVYVSMLTLRWLKNNGGIAWMEDLNNQKAELLYNEIDRNSLFSGTANVEDRSNMNATFVLINEALKEKFDAMWNDANISGIKGHRDVGGYRASMYNALPLSSVQTLVDVMKELEKTV